jgi:hypothetical protein
MINLFTADYGEIIKEARRLGYQPTETDPGKILDGACAWLQARGLAEYPSCDFIPADVRKMLKL